MFSSIALAVAVSLPVALAAPWGPTPYKHVIAISADGMHSSDVEKYLAIRPKSTIAALLATGYEFTDAFTTGPSDSFPGTLAQYTGAGPVTTGVWYDDTWDRSLYPIGSNCKGPAGAEARYDESIDYNDTLLFSGGINPAHLPLGIVNGKCVPIYPHMRPRVNTVFELVRAAGYQTAYADKHPAYDLVRGPSGTGLTAGYFPEQAATPTTLNETIKYDQLHVNAWLGWIDGVNQPNTEGGVTKFPALMGGNFQSVSVAQKTIEYNNDSSLSTGVLAAIDFVDSSLAQIVAKLKAKNLYDETLIIIASKHGQAPINPLLWNEVDPDALANATGVDLAFYNGDDISLMFLNHSSDTAKAVANLNVPATKAKLHINETISGKQLIDQGFGNPATDPDVPDIIVRPNLGTCYTTSKAKTAEHGGLSDDDRKVACFLSSPNLKKQVYSGLVSTKQIGPTILQALGINPAGLQGAVKEGTKALPLALPGCAGW